MEGFPSDIHRCFRDNPVFESDEGADASSFEDDDRRRAERLLCRLCGAPITTRADAVEREGRHVHTFFNPAGVLYEIACFTHASGCLVSGQPTEQFAWFSGTRWQFASCRGCDTHLGWYFTGDSGLTFYGLIRRLLISSSAES